MPAWMLLFAQVNPVDWAVVASRNAMLGVSWGSVLGRCALLAGFVFVSGFVATRAFRAYQRTS
jgi:ABC-2 type transport system permease protein